LTLIAKYAVAMVSHCHEILSYSTAISTIVEYSKLIVLLKKKKKKKIYNTIYSKHPKISKYSYCQTFRTQVCIVLQNVIAAL